ncbi:MT-A70 family methyltransferase [Sinorhizobium meliloti]|uniref:MT-A70 family methyltransferase n=1 Tax=Rhizobium meliloti TaxID=382 RepID=UPI002356A25C|nr:MT-A70 family methyltransferase [Sinorhizobium meliloti]
MPEGVGLRVQELHGLAEDDGRRKSSDGLCYRVRTTGEIVLVGALGNPKQSHVPPTIFDGIAREHSRKPEAFYNLCDRVMPHARRADVFAREQRSGWRAFGDEVSKFDPEVAAA